MARQTSNHLTRIPPPPTVVLVDDNNMMPTKGGSPLPGLAGSCCLGSPMAMEPVAVLAASGPYMAWLWEGRYVPGVPCRGEERRGGKGGYERGRRGFHRRLKGTYTDRRSAQAAVQCQEVRSSHEEDAHMMMALLIQSHIQGKCREASQASHIS